MEKSAYIRGQEKKAAEYDAALGRIDACVRALHALDPPELPPEWMMNVIGSYSPEHFKNTAGWTFSELVRRGRLTGSSRIIDIGSGCGRMALPFSFMIEDGEYYGTDVFREGVEWCSENISARNPAFEFHLQEVEKNYYFQDSAGVGNKMGLSFASDKSIDFIFAISVFTHLIEYDAVQYLREIARTLDKSGLAYLTTFLIDDFFFDYVKRTGKHTGVQLVSDGHYQAYSGQDFFAGFTMDRWLKILHDAGLEVIGFDPGSWADKPGSLHFQDVFLVAVK
ncbi:MAG: class I SAM-dependent methyltransferase [Hyphomonadaceae bacterium]|nr:class I SAM-dependent methyltransferase [Hyphomonadaceae bacterium]